MKKPKDYFAVIRDVESEVAEEIRSHLKRLNKDFVADNAEEISFFDFEIVVEQNISELTKEGNLLVGQYYTSIEKCLSDNIININDAISILNSLRELK